MRAEWIEKSEHESREQHHELRLPFGLCLGENRFELNAERANADAVQLRDFLKVETLRQPRSQPRFGRREVEHLLQHRRRRLAARQRIDENQKSRGVAAFDAEAIDRNRMREQRRRAAPCDRNPLAGAEERGDFIASSSVCRAVLEARSAATSCPLTRAMPDPNIRSAAGLVEITWPPAPNMMAPLPTRPNASSSPSHQE